LQSKNEKTPKNRKNGKDGKNGKTSSNQSEAGLTTDKCTKAHEITVDVRDKAYKVNCVLVYDNSNSNSQIRILLTERVVTPS